MSWANSVVCARCGASAWVVVRGVWSCSKCGMPMSVADIERSRDGAGE